MLALPTSVTCTHLFWITLSFATHRVATAKPMHDRGRLSDLLSVAPIQQRERLASLEAP
jgi:hypothetical protein